MSILRASTSARNSNRPTSAGYKPRYAGKTYPSATAEVEILRPICYPCVLLPDGQPGMVRINANIYLLYPLLSWEGDDFKAEGYRFVKSDTETHDVRITRWGYECDCPDATFRSRRDGQCKHTKTVRHLREEGNLI